MKLRRLSPLGLFAFCVAAFLVGPLLVVVMQSLSAQGSTDVLQTGPSFKWFRQLGDEWPRWWAPLRSSLIVAVVTTIISVLAGLLAGIATARHLGRLAPLTKLAILMPLIVPTVITGMALLAAFQGTPLLFSIGGVVAGHVVLTLPYAIFLVDRHVAQSNPDIERAAGTLGASAWQTFRWIGLPMIAPAAITAAVFVFYNSWEEVVVTSFISGTSMKTLPVAIFEAIQNEVSPVLAALSTMLMIATILVALVYLGLRRMVPKVRSRRLKHAEQHDSPRSESGRKATE